MLHTHRPGSDAPMTAVAHGLDNVLQAEKNIMEALAKDDVITLAGE